MLYVIDLLKYTLLGIVQGLSEFLPVSSSGHVMLAQLLLGMAENADKTKLVIILMHAGTLASVLIIFWKDWLQMLRGFFRSQLLYHLLIASLPALLIKILFSDLLDSLFEGWFLGFAFLITAVFLIITEHLSVRGRHVLRSDSIKPRTALIMGLMQGVSLVPGISRSGSSLLGGVASGLNRTAAIKFSFMMSAPAILGSLLVEGKKEMESGAFASIDIPGAVVGVVISGIFGFLAIRFMIKLIERISLDMFAVYLVVLGIIVIVLQITGIAGLPPLRLPNL